METCERRGLAAFKEPSAGKQAAPGSLVFSSVCSRCTLTSCFESSHCTLKTLRVATSGTLSCRSSLPASQARGEKKKQKNAVPNETAELWGLRIPSRLSLPLSPCRHHTACLLHLRLLLQGAGNVTEPNASGRGPLEAHRSAAARLTIARGTLGSREMAPVAAVPIPGGSHTHLKPDGAPSPSARYNRGL